MPDRDGALERAERAIALAQDDPGTAERLAERTLTEAQVSGDAPAEAAAEHALGLVARCRGDIAGAVAHLEAAIAVADRADLPERRAEARLSLAAALAYRGDSEAALTQLDRAAEVMTGLSRARVDLQRAGILARLGRTDDALDTYRRILPVFRRDGDRLREAILRNNRGLVYANFTESYGLAERDLRRALALREELGHQGAAAIICHNLGFVAAGRGDLPEALARFDEAERRLHEVGIPIAPIAVDHCTTLLAAGLSRDARTVAEQAVVELAEGDMLADLAECRLALSAALLAEGEPDAAAAVAAAAEQAFEEQGRQVYAALARHAALRACWAETDGPRGRGQATPADAASARAVAEDLTRTGQAAAAVEARALAGRIALEAGDTGAGLEDLAAAGAGRHRGPAAVRALAWQAEAERRLAVGDRRGAMGALRAGLDVVESQRASLGASELRAGLSAHGAESARLGVRLALADGRPEVVLAWAERARANSLRTRPVRPPHDPELARLLAELRKAVADGREEHLGGADRDRLLRRQTELETEIRKRTWAVEGPGAEPAARPPSVAFVRRALGARALVELIASDGQLHAVAVTDRRIALRPLGPIGPVLVEVEHLRFALRRSAQGVGSPRAQAGARAAAEQAATAIDDLVLGPVADVIGDRDLVLVPIGALHATPWSMLPSSAGRRVSVTPAAHLWLRSQRPGAPTGDRDPILLAAGPGLPEATQEVRALHRLHPGAVALTGGRATVRRVLAGLDGARVAHVAAHGTFRDDNPLFSAVELADGPLTVYDLESLRRPPDQIVLSCCHSGLSAVRPGEELMGAVAALLALGTRTVVASVLPVPDAPTRALVVDLHTRLAAGADAAAALAGAQAHARGGDDAARATAAAFVCFGG